MSSDVLQLLRAEMRDLIGRQESLDGWQICQAALENTFPSVPELSDDDINGLWDLVLELSYGEYKRALRDQRTWAITPISNGKSHKWAEVAQSLDDPIFMARIMFQDGEVVRIGDMTRDHWLQYSRECRHRADTQDRLSRGARAIAGMFRKSERHLTTREVLSPEFVQQTLETGARQKALNAG